jgi:hypothetical protein
MEKAKNEQITYMALGKKKKKKEKSSFAATFVISHHTHSHSISLAMAEVISVSSVRLLFCISFTFTFTYLPYDIMSFFCSYLIFIYFVFISFDVLNEMKICSRNACEM